VFSGLALAPNWGPFYGDGAVSEQSLAEEALERLPPEAMVLADGNFGIFAFAYAVQQSRRPMVLRLTEARAKRILGGPLRETDQQVIWRISRWDRAAHPQLPEEAEVQGRLIVRPNPSRPGELLILFTSLELPAKEIVEIYRLRWNVETDLRSLKRTLELNQLSSKSADMVEKELLLAVAAYNLVRAVMCLAAQRARIAPRQLSFSFVQAVVDAALPGLDRATTEEEYERRLERMLRYAAQGKHPRRPRTRTYSREVWGKGGQFPRRKNVIENRKATK
jgi:putative transposase